MTITLLVLIVAACISLVFVGVFEPASPHAYLFLASRLVLPYVAVGAALISGWRRGTESSHWHIVAVVVFVGGLVFLMNVVFWHPDPRGAIAVFMTPILQCGAAALLFPLAGWVSRKLRA